MSHEAQSAHKKHKKHKAAHAGHEGLPPVPIWFLSFGDMITNMLCFYILMVTLAPTKESGFTGAGTGSLLQAGEVLGPAGTLSTPNPISKDSTAPNFALPQRHREAAPDDQSPLQALSSLPRDRVRKTSVDYERPGRDVGLPTSIAFQPGTADLTPDSGRDLASLADLAQARLAHVTVEAHVSSLDDGWALSALRAAAVARYLHDHGEIDYDRITLAGHGRFQPIAGVFGKSAHANDRINVLLSSTPPD